MSQPNLSVNKFQEVEVIKNHFDFIANLLVDEFQVAKSDKMFLISKLNLIVDDSKQ